MSVSEPLPIAAPTMPNLDHPTPTDRAGGRAPQAMVDPLFLGRWSPRSFLPDPVPAEALASLFEAARWAPSSSNEQPWLYVYAREAEDRARFLEALHPFNRRWAASAPVIVLLFARRSTSDGRPYPHAPFDAGASWMSLALQARLHGLDTHPMGGILPEKAYEVAGVDPTRYQVLVAIAVGYLGRPGALPPELASREVPSTRRPLSDVAVEGHLPPPLASIQP